MPKISYASINIGKARLRLIEQANEIIAEYEAQGYELTLRQLYYQFVSRDIIVNTQREYKNLGDVINDGRMSGLIDWYAIVDRTRNLAKQSSWESPAEIVESCASQFKYDLWENQERYVEVWVEKDALSGVIERACNPYRVPYLSCRGYTSQSEMWGAGQRLKKAADAGKEPLIIHLGDHDPSGIDMSRDIKDRLSLFGEQRIEVRRIALNMDQVREYDPPPNPAKITDSRATGYISEFGAESWELDALEPSVLDRLISDEIKSVLDARKFAADKQREELAKKQLAWVADNWTKTVSKIKK